METTKPEDVNEALIAKSQTRTLDEIRSQGTEEVRVIRASDVASMISAKVDHLLRENTAMSDEDIEILVQRGPKEFKRVARERELERQRCEEDLQTAEKRVVELDDTSEPIRTVSILHAASGVRYVRNNVQFVPPASVATSTVIESLLKMPGPS